MYMPTGKGTEKKRSQGGSFQIFPPIVVPKIMIRGHPGSKRTQDCPHSYTNLIQLPLPHQVNNREHQEYRLIQPSPNPIKHVHLYCLKGSNKNKDIKNATEK